jgi:hypothetical protein
MRYAIGCRALAATTTLVVCFAPVQAAAAASPVPNAEVVTDISSVLLEPPASDYVAAPNGMLGSSHVGPLDLDALVAEGRGAASVRAQYEREGFTRGYREVWGQSGTSAVLIERVEEFERDAGAEDNLKLARFASQVAADFRGFFDTTGLRDAYGARLVGSDDLETDIVFFVKGNLLFAITAAVPGRTSTDVALNQAQNQYTAAPAETTDQRDGLPPAAGLQSNVGTLAAAFGTFVVLVLAALLVALYVASGRTPSKPLPVFADPRYWWDGSTWRDSAISIPDGAPRSPDGAHWFDGTAWRPIPRPGRRPPAGAAGRPGRFNIL